VWNLLKPQIRNLLLALWGSLIDWFEIYYYYLDIISCKQKAFGPDQSFAKHNSKKSNFFPEHETCLKRRNTKKSNFGAKKYRNCRKKTKICPPPPPPPPPPQPPAPLPQPSALARVNPSERWWGYYYPSSSWSRIINKSPPPNQIMVVTYPYRVSFVSVTKICDSAWA